MAPGRRGGSGGALDSDYTVPGPRPPSGTRTTPGGARFRAGRWDAALLGDLAERLDGAGRAALAGLSDADLLSAWEAGLATLLDPRSAPRRRLDPTVCELARLTPPSLQAALEAVLTGMTGDPARRLLDRAAGLERRRRGLIVAVLPANVPALAVQVLLPAMALRRPVLLKAASREPLLTAALVRLLGRRHPALAAGLAAVTWRGGSRELEEPVFAAAESVVAFGDDATLRALGDAGGDLLGHGSKMSVAAVSRDADLARAAEGVARDVALLEQRGCLSIRSVYTDADASAIATELAAALERRARHWPPAEPQIELLAEVQQVRQEALLRGLVVPRLDVRAGTVVVEPDPRPRPGPGLRTVRIHPVDDIAGLPDLLAPHAERLQGVALEGDAARSLAGPLSDLGISRVTRAGELQLTDATWANGEVHLLERLR